MPENARIFWGFSEFFWYYSRMFKPWLQHILSTMKNKQLSLDIIKFSNHNMSIKIQPDYISGKKKIFQHQEKP
jgi:hypothetical protein